MSLSNSLYNRRVSAVTAETMGEGRCTGLRTVSTALDQGPGLTDVEPPQPPKASARVSSPMTPQADAKALLKELVNIGRN